MKSQRAGRIISFKNSLLPISGIAIIAISILAACGGGAPNSAAPTLVSIAVAPTDPSVRFAQTQQLTANGNYSDGSTQDITASVVWVSSDTNVADITNGGATPGLATGAGIGVTTVSASLGILSDATSLAVIGSVSLPKTGQTTCYDPKGTAATVNCAGTGQDGDLLTGVDWPKNRFIPGKAAALDCVTDSLTGLMWTKDANLPAKAGPVSGKRTWQQALDYPKDLNKSKYCGFTDWRLPNIYELESLLDNEVLNQADNLNTKGFVNVQGSGPTDASGYWSSSTWARSTDSALGVDMHNGCVAACHLKTESANYVWPVRGGR